MDIWVPWRLGGTAKEQAIRRAGRTQKGIIRASAARERAVKARRRELLKKAKAGKISEAQYRKEIRKLGN